MSPDLAAGPLDLESLGDRLAEADRTETVPLRVAHQEWTNRALAPATASSQEPFGASIGKVIAIAAAVAAAAAVYKALSSQPASPEVLAKLRNTATQPDYGELRDILPGTEARSPEARIR